MSATADSTAIGSNPAPADASRLEQPNDAVPMENMFQSTSEHAQSAAEPGQSVAAEGTSQPASADAAAADSEKQGHAEADNDGATSSKGKEKETSQDGDGPLPPSKEDQDSAMAIGPAQDDIKSATPGSADGPVCNITLLLASGGRHPYKIDAKYLNRRNVPVPEETENGQPDPFSISTYTLKELILREWRSDWEAKPASPTSIRLIHFGKLLEDKEPLKKYQFSTESPTVVHMSIRPQDLDEEEPKAGNKNQSSGGGDGQRSRGGCCVVL